MKIFISYRRDDTKDLSARIADRLRSRYGKDNVFLDSASIHTGAKWRQQLTAELYACDALVAVIGDDWLELHDSEGHRRIDNPDDEVRREILSALERDIPIIPLLVEGVQMPVKEALPEPLRGLRERQWFELRSDQYFDSDLSLLCQRLNVLRKANRQLRQSLLVALGIALTLTGIVIGLVWPSLPKVPPVTTSEHAEIVPPSNGDGIEKPTRETTPRPSEQFIANGLYPEMRNSPPSPSPRLKEGYASEVANVSCVLLTDVDASFRETETKDVETTIRVRIQFHNIWSERVLLALGPSNFTAYDSVGNKAEILDSELPPLPVPLANGQSREVTVYFRDPGWHRVNSRAEQFTVEVKELGIIKSAIWIIETIPHAS